MRVESGGKRRGHRGGAPMAEINIIPLVDVVLVLLIIFMATTAFIKESGLNMKLPAAKTSEVVPQENLDINVSLTRDGKIFVDAKATTEAALQNLMVQRARQNAETRVVIKGDENIAYKRIVRVMDMAKQAGLPKVALGTKMPD
ncbi:MAG: biopolymer transport protein ExbD [Abditibacteriota bacterium]|nr:biopolymer transport protein ExbD [Abditibacteriota bacterium]